MSARILLAVYWRFWQGQLLPYAPQAKRALYAKLATALFFRARALPQVVDSTVGDVVQLVRTLPCHGRGREFESRRPRHSFQKSCANFAATNEGAKGHVFAPFLHPFSSIRAVFTSSAFTGLTTLTRVRWSSFQERRPAQGPLLAQRVLLARLPACKHPAWTVTRNAAATPASL